MKIGIMSYWDTQHNYGQLLQCFALQQFLRNLGHMPFHIRYIQTPLTKSQKIEKLVKGLFSGNIMEILRQRYAGKSNPEIEVKQKEECILHPRHFDTFRQKHLSFSPLTYTRSDLRNNPPSADAYIAGSDQIWGTADDGFMLNFGPNHVTRIAYAPSLGGVAVSKGYMRFDFRKRLKKLDVVTAREIDGVEECHKLGRHDTLLVPDPVFLLSANDYRQVLVPSPAPSPYILVYLLGNQIDIDITEIIRWAELQNLEIKYVTAQGRFDSIPKIYPNIDEWLGLIDNAEYVFTNSFHGMVASIILNRRFMVFPLSGSFSRMNSRLISTLNALALENRIYSKNLDAVTTDIDYHHVNKILEIKRSEITNLFTKWLSAKQF